MKKFLAALLMVTAMSCTSETHFGDCVGIDDEKNPELVYDVDVGNVVLGLVFFEFFFIPPAVVLLDETFCPVARRTP